MNQSKKLRIALLYDNRLRNDGPPLYWFNALRKIPGLEVIHLLPEGDVRPFGKMDVWLWVDFGEDSFKTPEQCMWMPPKDGGVTVYVASDTHLDDGYRFRKAENFQYVFFNQKRALDEYRARRSGKPEIAQELAWLPHAAEPQAYPRFEILPKYDVCFIGHIQDKKNFNGITRIDALDRLFKAFPNFYFGTRNPAWPQKNMFEDAAKRFCESRVVFNVSIGDDLNMRLFEILCTGSFQLTNWLPTLEELGLEDGVHLVTYRTLDEMEEKARYYLAHDQEREKIAAAGYDWFLDHGSYRHRALTMLETLGYDLKDLLINPEAE